MSVYSLDLREKIVESVKKGVSKSETARRFGIGRTIVKRFCKQLCQTTQRFVQTPPLLDQPSLSTGLKITSSPTT
jgi:transposase-like protein